MTKLPPPTSKKLAAELRANAIIRAGGLENYLKRKPYMTRMGDKTPQAGT